MELKKAQICDFERITAFYRNAIEHPAGPSDYSRWIYGKHPTDEMIRDYLKAGAMYYLEENGAIVSAVAVTDQAEDYHGADWQLALADGEVSVVHLLCVSPDVQRRGVGRRTMRAVMEFSRAMGKKAVRLDALSCNIPAQRLYESIGFRKRDSRQWYADNVGMAEFYLYEFVLA